MILGRVQNSTERIFDYKPADLSAWHQIKVVSSGNHFYAYLDDRMVVHGHGPAGSPGQTGFRIEGTGELLIKELVVEEI